MPASQRLAALAAERHQTSAEVIAAEPGMMDALAEQTRRTLVRIGYRPFTDEDVRLGLQCLNALDAGDPSALEAAAKIA
ncbi:hypothetical protein BS329_15800 [Amycolatopsis coloradensis]|uniref:Uncharacterized protein n=1 Tax=Amycolatopsis coloradensis TaxID=76021 RepID=A0A1R0KUL3_9PSEU|nr:hypothetical protein BS329_15800 [Amycolatopsis coloradensis]